jgi:hypothetical protein
VKLCILASREAVLAPLRAAVVDAENALDEAKEYAANTIKAGNVFAINAGQKQLEACIRDLSRAESVVALVESDEADRFAVELDL